MRKSRIKVDGRYISTAPHEKIQLIGETNASTEPMSQELESSGYTL